MKRFLMGLTLGSLAVVGSADAALLNYFSFGDKSVESSFVLDSDFSATTRIDFLQSPTTTSGLNPNDLTAGLQITGDSELIAGNVLYSQTNDAVTYISYSSAPSAAGTLPGGEFALALFLNNVRVDLTNVVELSTGAYEFVFGPSNSVIIDDLVAVPIPPAAILFPSLLAGLALVAKRRKQGGIAEAEAA